MTVARPLALTLAVALALPAAASAQTDLKKVHALLIADVQDPELAKSVETDVRRMAGLFRDSLPRDRYTLTVVRGDKVNPTDIKAAVDKLPAGESESLFVYYSGHGGQSKTDNRLFFALGYSGPGTRVKFQYYRDDLVAQLKAKKAGLTVLVTDCCSNRMATARGLEDPNTGVKARAGAGEVTEATTNPTVRRLLLQSRGLADVTAATNDLSFGMPTCGGFFTASFAKVAADPTAPPSWDEFHKAVVAETHRVFKKAADSRSVSEEDAAGGPQTPRAYTLPNPVGAVAGLTPPKVNPPQPVVKTYAVLALYSKSDKAVPIQYRWSNEPNKLKNETVPAAGFLCLSTEVTAGQPMPRITVVTDTTKEYNGKRKETAGKPTADDGYKVGVWLP